MQKKHFKMPEEMQKIFFNLQCQFRGSTVLCQFFICIKRNISENYKTNKIKKSYRFVDKKFIICYK